MNAYKKLYVFIQVLVYATPLFAVTPIFNDYKDEQNIYQEFRNVADSAQDQQFSQVTSTPNYQDLKDGQMVIYVSTPNTVNVNLMLRAGATLYVSPNFAVIQGR